MIDNSNEDDDGFVHRDADAAEAPFKVGAAVVLNPVYLPPGERVPPRKGKVLELRTDGSGWRVRVAWEGGDRGWVPANRLVGA